MTAYSENLRKNEVKLGKVASASPIAIYYQQQEERWDSFVKKNLPDAELLRWGKEHRVFRFGSRVIKVQSSNLQKEADSHHRIKYEFSLLKKAEGRLNKLNPEYRIIDGGWHILEMDWINSNSLEYYINNGRCNEISLFSLLRSLFYISLLGIEYKQFRARHIFPQVNGSFIFIDYGGSKLTNPIFALFHNFTPFSWGNGKLEWSRLPGLVKMILSSRNNKENLYEDDVISDNLSLANSLFHWKRNSNRNKCECPENLNIELKDKIAAKHLHLAENYLGEAINIDQIICEDIFQLQIAGYLLHGGRNWGFLWNSIRKIVSFTGKKVIDLGSCIGLVGVFSRFEGSSEVISFETLPELVKASEDFSKAFRINNNKFQHIDWDKLEYKKQNLPIGDIIFALSKRFDNVSPKRQLEIITNYKEIVWRTSNPNKAKQDLIKEGYRDVKIIIHLSKERPVIYAKK